MRLILGLPPPASSPFLPPRSLPRTGPLLRSGSRACFRACPRAGLCPSPRIVPISPPQSLPRTGPRLRSRSRACFRVYPRAGLCIGPSLVFASVPVPAPVSVPAPRWFLSQSPHRPHFPSSVSAPYRSPPPLRFPRLFPYLSRAGLCPNPGLGPRLCLGPAPLLSLLLFVPFVPASGYPKSLAAVFLLFFLDFSVFRSSPFLPCLLLLSLCQGWNSCISKFLVVHLRKI